MILATGGGRTAAPWPPTFVGRKRAIIARGDKKRSLVYALIQRPLSQAVPKPPTSRRAVGTPFDEHGVAELVRAIVVLLRLYCHRCQRVGPLKRAEEFVVTRAGLMHAGHNAINDQ